MKIIKVWGRSHRDKVLDFVPEQQYVELSVIGMKVCQHSAGPLICLRFASDKEAGPALAVSFDRNTVCPSLRPEEGSSSFLTWVQAKRWRMNMLFSIILLGNWGSDIKYCFPHILVWVKHKSEANKSLSPRNRSELGKLEDSLVRLNSTLKSSTSTAALKLLAAPASSRPDLLHGCCKQHTVCSLQVKL